MKGSYETLLLCLLLIVGCDKIRAVRVLSSNLERRYPESHVIASLDNHHVLSVSFEPLPETVQTASDRSSALKELARTTLNSITGAGEIDTVEVMNIVFRSKLPLGSFTSQRTVRYPISDLVRP